LSGRGTKRGVELDGVGVWSAHLRYGDPGQIAEAAAELDALGYRAMWIPDVGGDVLGGVEVLLGAAPSAVVATGVLNIWMHDPGEVAARRAGWAGDWQGRFLLGVGVSHAALIDRREAGRYSKPLSRMQEFLDGLDAAPTPFPTEQRVLAALRPRMLELSRTRASGAHPYFVPVEHTAAARAALGPGVLLAPEQAVVLETDAGRARATARQHMATYLGLPNYTNNLRRLGYTDDDINGGGSDRLVDAIVAWGDLDALARRVEAHRDAGANHVCVQVLRNDMEWPLAEWRALAPALA
jgi:probable F420-dependent oxidoreductase